MHAARCADVSDHALVFAPSRARHIVVRLKTAGLEFVVTQYRDAQTFALKHQRRVRLPQIHAPTHLRQTGALQQAQHLGEGLGAEVAGMVVGQGDRVKVPFQHRDHTRVGAESEHLVARAALGGDHAFEVGDADVGIGKVACKAGKRVTALRDQVAGVGVEHAVPGKDQADGGARRRFGARCACGLCHGSKEKSQCAKPDGQRLMGRTMHRMCGPHGATPLSQQL